MALVGTATNRTSIDLPVDVSKEIMAIVESATLLVLLILEEKKRNHLLLCVEDIILIHISGQ